MGPKIQPETLGSALWDALPYPPAMPEDMAADLIIQYASPAVQALPWELLRHPQFGFLANSPNLNISRAVGPLSPIQPPDPGALQVLLFTSLPENVQAAGRLDVETEQAHFLEAAGPTIRAGRLQLTTPDDGRPQHLAELLENQRFDLVILSGHGEFSDLTPNQPPSAAFVFEDDNGRANPVPAAELGRMFSAKGVGYVVLSACLSGRENAQHPPTDI